jgi:hypothetical protein
MFKTVIPVCSHRYIICIYRIDTGNLVKASVLADVGIFEIEPLEGEKERKRVERERIGCLVFKLATVALPIYSNPYYNHNPPMKEHSLCLRDRAASSSIYYKISMFVV